MEAQRRHFSRVPFNGEATFSSAGHAYDCTVLDLSLKGALIAIEHAGSRTDTRCELLLRLGGDAMVRMQGHVAHVENDHLGIACEAIDLDSITHLRRLIELNLGNPALLERELASLVAGSDPA